MPPREWSHGQSSVRRSVRRALHAGNGLNMFNRPAAHEIPDSPCCVRDNGSDRAPSCYAPKAWHRARSHRRLKKDWQAAADQRSWDRSRTGRDYFKSNEVSADSIVIAIRDPREGRIGPNKDRTDGGGSTSCSRAEEHKGNLLAVLRHEIPEIDRKAARTRTSSRSKVAKRDLISTVGDPLEKVKAPERPAPAAQGTGGPTQKPGLAGSVVGWARPMG